MTVLAALHSFAQRVRDLRRANADVSEPALAPAFQQLLTDLIPLLPTAPDLVVVPEFNKPGAGRPDIALIRTGEPPRAFIELKAPAKSADPEQWKGAHDTRQRDRLKELQHWAASNFVDFHLFSGKEPIGQATIVPKAALNPETSDAKANALIAAHDVEPFLDLLASLARSDAPAATSAEELAELMAHSARLVKSAVEERLEQLREEGAANTHPLLRIRETFKNVLYAHPEAGGYPSIDFDALFASAFAQTLAFGLLLVREATGAKVAADAWEHMPDEHPLMKGALEILSHHTVVAEIGIGFDVMRDTVNSFADEILKFQPGGRDPILYFYQDFLKTFDEAARDRYGVYYTPVEVVRYMVGALDRVLRDDLATQGLRDPAVTILDPATGTGTFLLGIAELVRDRTLAEEGGPAASIALRQLATRMFGFELLVGPYAVAHYRLHHALRYRPADDEEDAPQEVNLPRLGVYLADTLSKPDADTPVGGLGNQGIPIDEERAAANEIKGRKEILAIIGNPPYRRLLGNERITLVGPWIAGTRNEDGSAETGLWDDLKKPVSDAGKGNQLNTFEEFSVAFWRWSMWKLFEADNAPEKGVIAFISNRKFLTGWPYAGLRKMMRERFDRIEIIDLRGDVRAGPRGDVTGDQGVFNIQVGTAITIAIADGSKAEGELADVTYLDSWEAKKFSYRDKIDWLTSGAALGLLPDAIAVERGGLEDFRPRPFQNGEWLSVREAFVSAFSGIETTRDHLSYGFSQAELKAKIDKFGVMDEAEAKDLYSVTRKASFSVARARPFKATLATEVGYRPLDRRILFNELGYVDWPRPAYQRTWGASNSALFVMPNATGEGPGVWFHSRITDRHAFRGSYGGYSLPLYDRGEGINTTNLNPAFVAGLNAAYGSLVTPEDIFDAILALLSAKSYTLTFAEDLEDVFPHIPFPATRTVFDRAVAIGRNIRAVEGFTRPPEAQFRPLAFFRLRSVPTGPLASGIEPADGELTLCADGSGRITGVSEAVWSFSVSGYRVLPRWIEARAGLPADSISADLRDVAARIAELIHRFGEADIVLNETLAHTLKRAQLGFPAAEAEPVASDD